MYAWFRKLKAGLVKSDINDYVGTDGEMFFNTVTGEFRISDGVTPGGQPIPAASLLVSLRGVQDIDFTDLADSHVLTYDQFTNTFIWTGSQSLSPTFNKYIEGLVYTIPRSEHGIQTPTAINVYNPDGHEVSVEIVLQNGDITLISNVMLDGHTVSIA